MNYFKFTLQTALALITLSSAGSGQNHSVNDVNLQGGELKYGEAVLPDALDPVTSVQNMANIRMMELMFESLLDVNVKGEYVPRLAAELPKIQGYEVLFKLRENVTWHDGTPFSANDVKFTWELLKNPQTTTDPYLRKLVANIQSCTVLNPHTVKFTLAAVKGSPYAVFTFKIVPEHLIGAPYLQKKHSFVRNPVGTGPFKFQKLVESTFKFSVQDPHYAGRAYLDKITMEYVPDPQIMLTLIKSPSGLDAIVEARNQDLAELASTGKYNIREYNSMSFNYIGYNLKHPILGIKQIRTAITLGIDRAEILKVHYLNKGSLVSGPYPPGSKNGNPLIDPALPPFKPDLAVQLLKKTGCEDKNRDGILELNGKPLEFTLIVRVEDNDTPAALAIQDYLKQLGIRITIKHLDTETIKAVVFREKKFDMILAGWVFDEENDVSSLFHSQGYNNFIFFADAKVDKYIEAISRVNDPDQRRLLNHKLHELLFNELPYTFLWTLDKYAVIHKKVNGVEEIHPFYFFKFIKNWYIPIEYQ